MAVRKRTPGDTTLVLIRENVVKSTDNHIYMARRVKRNVRGESYNVIKD